MQFLDTLHHLFSDSGLFVGTSSGATYGKTCEKERLLSDPRGGGCWLVEGVYLRPVTVVCNVMALLSTNGRLSLVIMVLSSF